ncbi:MAG: FAD-dependent oxidoreductase [Chloroflexota bacterium]|nr:FAD-dependent oxidoreductase [Chloroflexota bacterium]
MKTEPLNVDALIIGAGIAGLQTALDLAEMGFRVAIVEKQPSIGGKMIGLSKVFPTLDCASCITTPKMAACAHHPNIITLTYSELEALEQNDKGFAAKISRKPRYVDQDICTGCRQCEYVCPVDLPHEFEGNLGVRRAIYMPFATAIPQIAVRDKDNCLGSAPCQLACPAGVDAKGFTALIASGDNKGALELIRKAIPFAGVCGRVCTHPCETSCHRGTVDEPIAIRSLKRFVADYEIKEGREKAIPINITKESKVAIIGSGPAGLACAYDLAKMGYPITVFEALSEAGGLLRYGIPEYRLPKNILDNEISYIEELGVDIKRNTRIESIEELFNQGYEAMFIASGAGVSQRLGIPNENTTGITDALGFLSKVNSGDKVTLGKRVLVIGGGNAAIDAARVAKRLGAEDVSIVYRRSRQEMPAMEEEIEQAEQERIGIRHLAAPINVLTNNGTLNGMRFIEMELGEPDESGRRIPIPVEGSEFNIAADNIILAIGQNVEKSGITSVIKATQKGTLSVDPITQQTNIQGVFAGGDVATGPATVISAIKAGRDAAISINRYLRGMDLQEGRSTETEQLTDLPKVESESKARIAMPMLNAEERSQSFSEVEIGFDEQAARKEADRCLSCLCGNCERVCPTNAIQFSQEPKELIIKTNSVVVATGFEQTPMNAKHEYNAETVPNVISSLQMERLLAPNGPYGRVLRPSDGKIPESIAYVQCAGSRDKSIGVPYCSRVCCMYAIKQTMLLSGALPLADITIYFMDIRAFGKGYEEFYQNSKAMGIEFVKGKVARILEGEDQSPIVRVELIEENSTVVERQHDLVVLSLGMLPGWHPNGTGVLKENTDGFIYTPHPKIAPTVTSREGIFVAGTSAGPKDIVDSIVEAGSAAMEVSTYLKKLYKAHPESEELITV